MTSSRHYKKDVTTSAKSYSSHDLLYVRRSGLT